MNSARTSLARGRGGIGPIARRSVTDEVAAAMRNCIILGTLKPGQHLAEARLAAELEVSRAPVREAMIQLEREGLLSFTKLGKATVREFDAADFEEILSLRVALETMAARRAVQSLSRDDLALLESLIAEMEGAPDLLEAAELDMQFHEALVRAAGHRRLLTAWCDLRSQIELVVARSQRQLDAEGNGIRITTAQSHRRLLAALRAGDPDHVERTLRDHIGFLRQQIPVAPRPSSSEPIREPGPNGVGVRPTKPTSRSRRKPKQTQ